jgi:hypothetical protein
MRVNRNTNATPQPIEIDIGCRVRTDPDSDTDPEKDKRQRGRNHAMQGVLCCAALRRYRNGGKRRPEADAAISGAHARDGMRVQHNASATAQSMEVGMERCVRMDPDSDTDPEKDKRQRGPNHAMQGVLCCAALRRYRNGGKRRPEADAAISGAHARDGMRVSESGETGEYSW